MKLITATQFADQMGYSRQHINYLIKRDKLIPKPPPRIGREWLVYENSTWELEKLNWETRLKNERRNKNHNSI